MTDRHPRPTSPTARDLMRESDAVPLGADVRAAAGLLGAAGVGVLPVVDSTGRCVGLFTARDYRRWSDRGGVAPMPAPDQVRHHMTRRFAIATPEAGLHELRHRLAGAADPVLVVLDRQRRPMGVVYGPDVLAAESARTAATRGGVSV